MTDVVLNASPWILLCKVGQADLVRKLCGTVCMPQGVVAEIEAEPNDPACRELGSCAWLRRVAVSVPDGIKAWDLGRGESEVVACAPVQPGFRPVLDDAEGKAYALAHGRASCLSPSG